MTLTLSSAVDEMSALFKAAWDANTLSIAGYVPQIEWYGAPSNNLIDRSKFWVRFSTQAVDEEQATLSDCVETPFARRYTGYGLVFIQVFAPKTIDDALITGRKLGEVARNAFRGKTTPGKVWFRNVRIVDVAPEEMYYRLNIVAEYEHDETG